MGGAIRPNRKVKAHGVISIFISDFRVVLARESESFLVLACPG
jgi:hypothetical protein